MNRYLLVASVLLLTWSAICAKPLEIKGQVKELDLKKGTITLAEGTLKFPIEHTYSLTRPDLPVTLPTGKPGKVSDLKEGAKIGVQLLGDDVTAIRIYPTTLVASFARWDEKARTLAVRQAGSPTDSVFMLHEDATLLVNNKEAPLKDLKVGQKVQLVFAGDKSIVLQVQAGADVAAVKETKVKLTRQTGILLDHDVAQRKARIIHVTTSNVQMKEYTVAADAEVRFYHAKHVLRVIPFKDLSPFLKVHFFMDADTHTIVSIDAEQAVLRRKIVALDVDKLRITIEDEKKNRTYELAPKVKVFVAGQPERLEKIKGATWANVGLSPDRTQVEALYLTKADLAKAK